MARNRSPIREFATSSTDLLFSSLSQALRLPDVDSRSHHPVTPKQDPFVRIVPSQIADTLRLKSETRPLTTNLREDDFKDGHIVRP